MKNRIRAFILAFLTPAVAFAVPAPSGHAYKNLGTLLSAGALNGSPTITLKAKDISGYGLVALDIAFTRVAATNVAMTCTTSTDDGTTKFTLQSCAVSAGDCTSSGASWTKTTSVTGKWTWRVDTVGLNYLQCTFTGASAGATDLLTITGLASSI